MPVLQIKVTTGILFHRRNLLVTQDVLHQLVGG